MKRTLKLFLLGSLFISTATATTYYISPTGNDGASGTTEGQALGTFDKAWEKLYPSDTLIILDGTYTQRLNPNKRNGEPGKPIVIRAKNDGKVVIDGEGQHVPVQLGDTWPGPIGRHFVIEGIVAKNGSREVFKIWDGYNTLRRCSGYNADTDDNTSVFSIWAEGTGNILLEDCVAAGTGRKMFCAYHAWPNIIFRRCFAAWQEWRGSDFNPGNWPWGDGIEFYGHRNAPIQSSIMENCINFGRTAKYGISLSPNPTEVDNVKILGCMSIRAGMKRDGTILTWNGCDGTGSGYNPDNPNSRCTDFDNWPNHRVGFMLGVYQQPKFTNNLFQDLFATECAGAGLGAGPWASGSNNNKLVRAMIVNNGIGNPPPGEGANVNARSISLGSFTEITDCHIGGTAFTGGKPRLARRYINGVYTNEPLWPWPMQDRTMAETGIDVTGTITSILEKCGVQTDALPVTQVGTPTISPNGGSFLDSVQVTLWTYTADASIRYTLDGSEPTASSQAYTGPIVLKSSQAIKAKAFKTGLTDSDAASADFTVETGSRVVPVFTNSVVSDLSYDVKVFDLYGRSVLLKNALNSSQSEVGLYFVKVNGKIQKTLVLK